MGQDIYLTGITTTGTPHIGNYVGAIRPGIEASKGTLLSTMGMAQMEASASR